MTLKNKIIAFFICLFGAIGGYLISTNLIISISASLDHRFFIKKDADLSQIKKGDYIQFHLTHDQKEYLNRVAAEKKDGDITAIKIVKVMPGEALENKDNCFFSESQPCLGCAKYKSRTGQIMKAFNYKGLVPDGSFFVMGTNIDSFDSRYFGFVEVKNVISILRPIF